MPRLYIPVDILILVIPPFFLKLRLCLTSLRVFVLFSLFSLSSLEAQTLNPPIRAHAAILYNPKNRAILYEKRGKDAHYPSSILKLVIALYIVESDKPMDHLCLATEEALAIVDAQVKQSDLLDYPPYLLEHDAITMGIKKGEVYSVSTLLHGMLLCSANDAANVVAQTHGGTIENFMEHVNCFIKGKGILQTRFQNPHGLYHPAQWTTAYDMALLGGYIFENVQIRKILGLDSYVCENGEVIKNTNPLLREGKFFYPKLIGGKTGYTESSGFNIVAMAQDGDRELIAVLLGCKSSTERSEDLITLFESAFQEKPVERLLFSKDHESFTHRLGMGKSVEAQLDRDVVIEVYPAEQDELLAEIEWDEISLPVAKKDLVGAIVVRNPSDCILLRAPLYAKEDVSRSMVFSPYLWIVGLMVLGLGVKGLKQHSKLFNR